MDQKQLLEKYGDIIKEEVNVKEIWVFTSEKSIKKVFKPIGSALSSKFGKDTGQIIANGKQGNIKELGNGQIEVFSPQGRQRILESTDYEVAYEGLDAKNVAVDGDIIAELNLQITPELEREGVARELSRFLNQMRKDANFSVEERVHMSFETESSILKSIINEFAGILKDEALLSSLEEKKEENWIIRSIFTSNNEEVHISLNH